jgi:hypothetical protein
MVSDEEFGRMCRRLDVLERQYLKAKVVGAAATLAACALLLTTCGRETQSESVLRLRDPQGRVRVEMSAAGSSPYLHFLDPAGAIYTSLDTDSQTAEPVVTLRGGDRRRISAEFSSSGMGASVTTLLDGQLQTSITALSVSPVVLFTGPNNGSRLELESTQPKIVFVDAEGNVTGTLARQR